MNDDGKDHWQPRRIGIVGVGLIGGSVALAARRRWPEITIAGSSRKSDTRHRMLESQIVDHAFEDALHCVANCDFVVIAAPVGNIATMLKQIADACTPDAIITDVGSTKSEIVAAAESHLDVRGRFVGSHPIAGSEMTGLENALSDLFDGKLSITTPTAQTDTTRHERVQQFWRAIGCHVVSMSPEEHDLALAAASHVPHIVSAALAQALPMHHAYLTGTGFSDATRIAAGDPLMWRQIVQSNAAAILDQLDRYNNELARFRNAIEQSNWILVEELFTQAQHSKRSIEAAKSNP